MGKILNEIDDEILTILKPHYGTCVWDYTASCLHSESYELKSHKCLYCSENHSTSQCKKVTNRQ